MQQTARKVLCLQRKYRAPYIKYMDKQSEFLLFPTSYCGKTRVITTRSFSKQRSHEFFLLTDSNYPNTFQHVNMTFNIIFDSFKSHCLTNASINRMCRSITIF